MVERVKILFHFFSTYLFRILFAVYDFFFFELSASFGIRQVWILNGTIAFSISPNQMNLCETMRM